MMNQNQDQNYISNLGKVPKVFKNNKVTRISTLTEMGGKLENDRSYSSLGMDEFRSTSNMDSRPP